MEDNPDDKGHLALLEDIGELYEEVKSYQFHDFVNNKHNFPKMELYKKIVNIADKIQKGEYDN